MTTTVPTVTTTIDILGKPYPIRCPETELPHLQAAAEFLNQKMLEAQEPGKVNNHERMAIITALNIANQLLQSDKQINQRIVSIQEKLDMAIQHA